MKFKIEVDIAFDDNFEECLMLIFQQFPGVIVSALYVVNGWPCVTFESDDQNVLIRLENYLSN
jgi:hypothetical protein